MSADKTIDTLTEFHLHNPNNVAYTLLAHLISVLEDRNLETPHDTPRNVTNLLGETESTSILKLVCQKNHVDYLQLLQDCQDITIKHISPRLLLHIACLPAPYVAEKLQIDEYRVNQLLDQLKKNFTIDDPILWLKRALNLTEKERIHAQQDKENLLHGLAVVNQPVDTAEERWHKPKLNFKPYDAPR